MLVRKMVYSPRFSSSYKIIAKKKQKSPNFRLVVMSYQSLEDRIVKNHFMQVSKSKTPLQLPVELPDSAASYKLLIGGSQGADEDEQDSNPRSQSMRLRAIERVAA